MASVDQIRPVAPREPELHGPMILRQIAAGNQVMQPAELEPNTHSTRHRAKGRTDTSSTNECLRCPVSQDKPKVFGEVRSYERSRSSTGVARKLQSHYTENRPPWRVLKIVPKLHLAFASG